MGINNNFEYRLNHFIPKALTEAREARGLTKSALAPKLNISPQMISKYENGQSEPSAQTLRLIAAKLNMPLSYFFKEVVPKESVVFFRSQAAARVRSKKIHVNRIKWLQRLQNYFEIILDFPNLDIPHVNFRKDFRETPFDEIENLTLKLRKYWGLGLNPIPNLTLLLEKKGIIISSTSFSDMTIDACSTWDKDNRPFVFLNYDKGSAVRSRFDLAHELGHLLLHSQIKESDFNKRSIYKRIEQEANYFASSFLLPEESFGNDLQINSLSHYIVLKEKWKVSIAAMIYRAETLGLLSDYQVLHMRKELARRNMRTVEPLDDEIRHEKPQALNQAIKLILDNNVKTKGEIINEVGLSDSDIEAICGLEKGYLTEKSYQDNVIPFTFKK